MDFKKVAVEIAELVERKNKDYGNSFDKTMNEYGNSAYFLRIDDKLSRIKRLLEADCTPQVDESIEDTLKDIIGYTLLMLNYYYGADEECKGGVCPIK